MADYNDCYNVSHIPPAESYIPPRMALHLDKGHWIHNPGSSPWSSNHGHAGSKMAPMDDSQ